MVEAADEKSATLTRRGAIRLAFRSRTDQAGFSGMSLRDVRDRGLLRSSRRGMALAESHGEFVGVDSDNFEFINLPSVFLSDGTF